MTDAANLLFAMMKFVVESIARKGHQIGLKPTNIDTSVFENGSASAFPRQGS
jgi:hypothetical protein